jgi:hypothetical protein
MPLRLRPRLEVIRTLDGPKTCRFRERGQGEELRGRELLMRGMKSDQRHLRSRLPSLTQPIACANVPRSIGEWGCKADGYRWWQSGTIYQIYPRSFQDSNGDGIGDLAGIIERLDHLLDLGIDAIWISPIYPSPMADFGYDVADYQDVDPVFGTLAQFDALIAAAHGRGLRIILDYVPNHSSDRHPWFVESRSSRSSPKRDWYIWRELLPVAVRPTTGSANLAAAPGASTS